jgi:hypothetical protein
LIILSNRQGTWGFYKQNQNASLAAPIITDIKAKPIWAAISPDRRWLLYAARDGDDPLGVVHIMRVPLSGGLPEETGEGRAQAIKCPNSASSMCVLSEVKPDNQEVNFVAWDPLIGRAKNLGSFRHQRAEKLRWELSPDGNRIAISDGYATIDILSLIDNSVQRIFLGGDVYFRDWAWAGDGKGLFVSSTVQQGTRLCYLDFQGRLQTLWEVKGQKVFLVTAPAPDSHAIAVAASANDANEWMMERF